MMRKAVTAGCSVVAVLLAGCGSSAKTSTTSATTSATTPATTPPVSSPTTAGAPSANATVKLSQSSLGSIVTDSAGRTLYLLDKDTPTMATCTGACASTWPPLAAAGAPTAGANLDAAKLSTLTRADGTVQVEYAGHPLYHYSGDASPGDTNGEGFGGVWFAVTAGGTAAQKPSTGGGY
ncbi:MAG TPA: hypothetical protein VF954_05155 [Acidimicrobiales bacterium]